MTGVLIRRRPHGDRDWSYVAASREQPKVAGQARDSRKRQGSATLQVSGQ